MQKPPSTPLSHRLINPFHNHQNRRNKTVHSIERRVSTACITKLRYRGKYAGRWRKQNEKNDGHTFDKWTLATDICCSRPLPRAVQTMACVVWMPNCFGYTLSKLKSVEISKGLMTATLAQSVRLVARCSRARNIATALLCKASSMKITGKPGWHIARF
jgi:hypothetical protein